MPGPCSAPNGNSTLVGRTPKENEQITTGKSAIKAGHERSWREKKFTQQLAQLHSQAAKSGE